MRVNARGDAVPQVAPAEGAAAHRLRPRDHALQVVEHRRAVRAVPQVRVDGCAFVRRQLAVQIVRQLVRPFCVHDHIPTRCFRINIRARCSCRFDVPGRDVEHRARSRGACSPRRRAARKSPARPAAAARSRCSKSTVRSARAGATVSRVQRRRVVRHPLPLNRERSPPLDDDVDRQAVQPGRERRVAAELTQLLPGPDEDVLRDLVGLRGC